MAQTALLEKGTVNKDSKVQLKSRDAVNILVFITVFTTFLSSTLELIKYLTLRANPFLNRN